MNKPESSANQQLLCDCCAKQITLESIVEHPPETGPRPLIDLVILADTSDSMRDEMPKLAKIAAAAISNPQIGQARRNGEHQVDHGCAQENLKVIWLGIEDIWAETKFEQTCRDYLINRCGVSPSALRGRRRDTVINQGAQEDISRSIIDIATYFEWRSGAQRLLLILGDEGLDGGNPVGRAELCVTDEAIAKAQDQDIQIYAYAGTGVDNTHADSVVICEYEKLASATGGKLYTSPTTNLHNFAAALAALYRDADQSTTIPAVQPQFEIWWGDGPKDAIKTTDWETLCIVAHNPYRNVRFKALRIVDLSLARADEKSICPRPDGTPSLQLTPSRMVGFGDLQPSTVEIPSSSIQEVTLVSSGSEAGRYCLHLSCRSTAELTVSDRDIFEIELLPS